MVGSMVHVTSGFFGVSGVMPLDQARKSAYHIFMHIFAQWIFVYPTFGAHALGL